MTDHPNKMTVWPEIECQRPEHGEPGAKMHHCIGNHVIDLSKPHRYHDYPQVPAHLVPAPFKMHLWDLAQHPVDGGPYCPAHDAVSATILSHGIWEPRETIFALDVFKRSAEPKLKKYSGPHSMFLDFGSQLGWFSLLALASGVRSLVVEADRDNLVMAERSFDANKWDGAITSQVRVGPSTDCFPRPWLHEEVTVCLAKLDLEGAERDAIRLLWPAIEAGSIDRLLIEVSPVFDDYYPDLVCDLIDVGYRAYRFPGKSQPPARFTGEADLLRIDTMGREDLRWSVASCHQEDLVFVRDEIAL